MVKHNVPVSPVTLAFASLLLVALMLFPKTSGNSTLLSRSNTASSAGSVLGEDEVKAEEKSEKPEDVEKKEDSNDDSDRQDSEKTPAPTISEDSIKVSAGGDDSRETEVETSDGRKIKTKIEDDGSTKVEIEHRKLKIKLEIHNGKITTKAEDENGVDVELNEQESEDLEQEVESELERDGIKISTGSAGVISFAKNSVSATTRLPLSIDVGTNQLVVMTPKGPKVVAVLPDQVIKNLIASGVISSLSTDVVTDKDSQQVSGAFEFTMKDDQPVYEVKGEKSFKLLGVIPTSQPLTALVSPENGEVLEVEQPLLTKIVDFLSP